MRRLVFSGVQIFILVGFVGLVLWLFLTRSGDPTFGALYAQALGAAAIHTEVVVHGVSYTVENGQVKRNGALVSITDAQAALHVAYAQALARRTPLFDTQGTNADVLDLVIDKLISSTAEVAAVQPSSSDADALAALYPIEFLRSLATLERARSAFVMSGSDVDARAYDAALRRAVQSGTKDAEALSKTIVSYIGGKQFVIPGVGGAIHERNLQGGIETLRTRMSKIAHTLAMREDCIAGDSGSCTPKDLLPTTTPTPAPMVVSNTLRAQSDSVQSALENSGMYTRSKLQTWALASSSCLGALPGPYMMTVPKNSTPGQNADILFAYVGDIYFQKLSTIDTATSSFLGYAQKTLHLSYLKVNPVMFYTCPELGDDFGRLGALRAMVAFAQNHQEIAVPERAKLLEESPFTEWDALSYLHAATKELYATGAWPEFEEANDLARAYIDRSVGLERVVYEIGITNAAHAARVKEGAVFDISAYFMFATHTAYPTLYLGVSPSAGNPPIVLREQNALNKERVDSTYSTYLSLIKSVPKELLVENIRNLGLFDRGGQ